MTSTEIASVTPAARVIDQGTKYTAPLTSKKELRFTFVQKRLE